MGVNGQACRQEAEEGMLAVAWIWSLCQQVEEDTRQPVQRLKELRRRGS
jgi:hypothetical protein